jgi:hypothetical protein
MERHRKHYQEDLSEASLAFPHKLFALMSREDGKTVSWLPHGFAFRITKPDAFVNETVPKYFKRELAATHSAVCLICFSYLLNRDSDADTKLTSFQRQLNLYGFRRLTKGDDQGAYFHPKFQRDRKDLIDDITRLPAKGAMETLEDVMSASRNPSSHLSAHKKRALNSAWVTPVRGGDETNHMLTSGADTRSSRSVVATDQGMGRYRTRQRIAMQEMSTVTPVSSLTASQASSQAAGTNALGMPLLHIPEDEPRGVMKRHAYAAHHQHQHYAQGSSSSTPYYAGSTKSKLTANLGFSEDLTSGKGYLFSPASRFHHHDDFSDLCPDLIGSPSFYSGVIDQSLLDAAAGFDGLPSPTGMCILPTPAHLRPQAGMHGTATASSSSAVVDAPAQVISSATPLQPAKLPVPPALTASTAYSEESGAPLVSPLGSMAPAAPVHAPESSAADVPIPPATVSAFSSSSSNALSAGEEHDAAWMSGHVSDAFDALLDLFCGPVDAPVASAATVPAIPAIELGGTSSGGYSSASSSGVSGVGGAAPTLRVPVLAGLAGGENMLWHHDGAHEYVRSAQYA